MGSIFFFLFKSSFIELIFQVFFFLIELKVNLDSKHWRGLKYDSMNHMKYDSIFSPSPSLNLKIISAFFIFKSHELAKLSKVTRSMNCVW